MKSRLTAFAAFAKGMAIAVSAMAIYALSLGFFIALLLLVISIEEGGESLSEGSLQLTQAVILLTQGTGFTLGSIRLTIVPLALMMLLVALIRQLACKLRSGLPGLAAGLVTWIALDLAIAMNCTLKLGDPMPMVALKGGLLFLAGYALSLVPGSRLWRDFLSLIRDHVSDELRHALKIGILVALCIIAVTIVFGAIAVVTWIWMGRQTVASLFESNGMETGSRILVCICGLAWFPNAVIWAVSWLSGSGFSIGDIAEFSMWSGRGSGLPALPLFGILPASIDQEWLRFAMQLAIPVASFAIALAALLLPFAFHITLPKTFDRASTRDAVLSMAYPAGGFCLSAGVISVDMTLVFALSNGGLGTRHLAHVGVDVMASTQAVGRPASLGLLVAWLSMVIAMAASWGIHWLLQRYRNSKGTLKEGTDDKHEPADQEGAGLGLS